jgi:hypothetical protein
MGEQARTALWAIAAICVWSYIAASWVSIDRTATQQQPETEETQPEAEDCLSPARYGGTLLAVTRETVRAKGRDGFGAPLHGDLFLQGHCYHFVSGGRGRGSIPHQRYQIGNARSRPYLNAAPGHTAYPLSNAHDPIIKDTRSALFIHPGHVSAGCIAIDPRQWPQFERDMQAARPQVLELVAGGSRDG